MFQRRHYEIVAEVLRASKPKPFAYDDVGWPERRGNWVFMITRFCERFAQDNPSFNRERFCEACGAKWVEEGRVSCK